MMEGFSGSKKLKEKIVNLTDLVFSWSLEDIFDKNLYLDQVGKIPTSFASVEEYLGSYIFPLLEETREELYSSMETMHSAPFAEVAYLDEAKPYGTLMYDVKVDHWNNRFSDRGKEPYRTLPGDILVLSHAKPESASDLQQVGRMWTFGSVINITEDGNEDSSTSTHFKLKLSNDIEFNDGGKSIFAVFLMNITTNKRIWNTLHMLRNLNVIKKVLCTDEEVEENCEVCYEDNSSQLDDLFDSSALNLNNSQTEAVLSALRKMKCDHKPSVELIWGPPGTGKTKTISVMLFVLRKLNLRTLVCAPTNVAITEIASRLLNLVAESRKVEFGNNKGCYSYGDILLFGNKDRLKVASDIDEIYVDYRVSRLTECLGPLTGWQHSLSSMISLLEDCVSQYNVFVENELIKEKEEDQEDGNNELEYKTFLEFMRARYRSAVSPLRQCLLTFCTHLPLSFVGESTFDDMATLSLCLDLLERKLFEDVVVSELLEKLFSDQETIEDTPQSYADMSLLLSLRMQSLSIGRSLRQSLYKLNLPSAMNRDSIMEFCFQQASVIFCTASSSYKLHSVDMEPLKVLVIDEAAQLKECESAIPLQLQGVQHAILIGDECQLPATVRSPISDQAGFGRSLFERLSLLGHSKHLLNIQYRMHPSISFFPNSKFYRNQISNAQNVQSKSYEKNYLPGPMFGAYSFINIVEGREEMDDVGHSRRNMVEVAVVTKIVHELYKVWGNSRRKLSVGVISPYAAQVVAIQDKIVGKYEKLDGFSVKVKSVDGFQGGEDDVIIISTVRSNTIGSIGFISSPQRTNVALTRARHSLWILGNERTLTDGESIWKDLVRDAKNRNCFFGADEDKNLAKSILDMKKELDQLDDLLNGASVLFKSSRWKVIFSDNFRKSFGGLVSRMKKSILNLLLKLSSGWRPKNRTVDSVCESSSQILKKFKVEGLYVVCTIDIMKESNYKQVLKVWDVLPLEEMPKLVKRLDSIFSMYTNDFINHCNEKFLEGNLEIPKCWSTSKEIYRYKSRNDDDFGSNSGNAMQSRSYVENSRVNDSLLLMKFYSLSSVVVNHLLSDHGDKNFDLPFEVTDEEMEIILHDKSSFILGRSGTGKTTVLTMKLYKREECYYLATEGRCVTESIEATDVNQRVEDSECKEKHKEFALRQLFVTVSPKLCYAVKQQISQLKSFARGGKFSEDSLIDKDSVDDAAQFKEIPDSFHDIPPDSYPLVITYQKFLMMLDGTLEISYFERFREARELYHGRYMGSTSVAFQTSIRTKEVNFDKFCTYYWPHFSNNLTKKLDSSRVFTEIISHIKGGLHAMESCDGRLDRDEYLRVAECRVSTLSWQMRDKIFDIYKDYEKIKMERGEYDLADLVIDLHRRLRNERFEGQKIDFVYIDEVQDLTMSQISLFKYICGNVDEGFVFSGDTAQTIARGIDFRFQDIRSLFYKVFMESGSDGHAGRKEKGRLSEIFNLRQNFRTHDGVLRLAQSVIDLIYRFFPNLIDVLKPETSLIHGEAPVLLEPGNDENAIVTIFGNTGSVERKIVGFGAEQVILVRDDFARKEISKFVGKQALVLTILECKGLEFQDVLLYNFFGSSPLKNQWRVIYEFMSEQDLLDATCPQSFPSFSEARHNLLCSELKQLYVAITRTRQRLWISENLDDLSKPMFDYWRRKCLVQVRKLDESLGQAMQVASSSEEWKARGVKLYFEHNYEMATMCFERAGDLTWEKRAKASGLKAAADRMRESNFKVACTYLREAAEIFDSIGKAESAAACYCDLGEFEIAGRIYLDKCGETELKKAAECFNLAGLYNIAAEVYAKGSYFAECLSVCTKAKIFDVGLQYIEYWKQHNFEDNAVVRSKEIENLEQVFLEGCALSYSELNDNKSMMKFVRAFHSMDLKRSFLKSRGCLDELLFLEEESGNFVEAAEIASLLKDNKSMMKFVRAFNSMDLKRSFLKSRGCLDELLFLEEESGNFVEAAEIASRLKDNKSMMKFVGAFHSMDLKRSFLKSRGCLDELLFLEEESGNFVEAAEIASLLKDNKSMMKFVRAFHSMDLKRSFLKSRGCLDELLFLEEESGNFVEAAEIASLRGNLLHEADLRGKSGNFREASSLILWYICCKSLWMYRSKGWPLKNFTEKEELLYKAKEFAKKESESWYELVCSEANILLHEQNRLAELSKLLEDSQKQASVRGEILCLRKILDAHFTFNASKYVFEDELPVDKSSHSEEMISANQVSLTSLLYFWSLWKENTEKLFEYLSCLEYPDVSKYLSHGEFCLNYLGIWRQFSNLSTTFHLLIPDADWLRKVDDRTLRKTGNMIYIDPQQLVFAARCYWQSEVLFVGIKILQTIEALFRLATKNASMFSQSRCLVHMFEVAKGLLNCKFLDCKYHDSKTLLYFVDMSTNYCQNVFPLDWRKTISENFIYLRDTDNSRKLLEEAILCHISNKGELTYGQIGKVVMMWLGTRKPTELYRKILKRFEENIPWMTFIKNLSGEADRNSQDISDSESPSKEFTLICLYKALKDTYGAEWRTFNYISPHSFLYLVDRLLIMTSSFQGFIVTTRSSYVEWMLAEESVLCPNITPGSQSSIEEIYNFLAYIADQLLRNNWETEEWIGRSQLDIHIYHPLLVLKLFVILCLLCLYSNKYKGLLLDLLEKGEAQSMLPKEFLDVLKQCKKRNIIDLSPTLLSDALSKIGDPLVTVSFGKKCPEKYRVSICVDMGTIHSKDDIIKVLFPRKAQNHQNPIKGTPTASASVKDLSGGDDLSVFSKTPASTMTPSTAHSMNGHGLKMNWGVFGEIVDALKTGVGESRLMTMSTAVKLKVEVDSNKEILAAAIAQFFLNPSDGEDRNAFTEANKMLDELEQCSSALDTRDKKRVVNFQSIGELVKSLQSKRQKLEEFCNRPLVYNPMIAETAAGSSNIDKSINKDDVEPSKAEQTSNRSKEKADVSTNAVSSNTQDGCANQEAGRKKWKANNKSQKKTKGKGRKGR